MIRVVYIALLRLHPRRFRERYADEMLWIFDQSRERPALLGDALVSLARQWLMRPDFHDDASFAIAAGRTGDIPVFYSCDSSGPSRGALVNGGLLSLVAFGLVGFLIGLGGGARKPLLIGSHHPSPSHLLPVPATASPEGVTTEVKVAPPPEERPLPAYFRLIRVLAVLDVDRNGVISSVEIGRAPALLRKLDTNRDGNLSAEECGGLFSGDEGWIKRARLLFMRIHPALAVLDADHDGEISSRERKGAAAALRTLDRNGVGSLTEDELAPGATTVMLLFDLDSDGRISAEDRAAAGPEVRALFVRADADRDGLVTKAELEKALGLR